jgi:hypothetical protein
MKQPLADNDKNKLKQKKNEGSDRSGPEKADR